MMSILEGLTLRNVFSLGFFQFFFYFPYSSHSVRSKVLSFFDQFPSFLEGFESLSFNRAVFSDQRNYLLNILLQGLNLKLPIWFSLVLIVIFPTFSSLFSRNLGFLLPTLTILYLYFQRQLSRKLVSLSCGICFLLSQYESILLRLGILPQTTFCSSSTL